MSSGNYLLEKCEHGKVRLDYAGAYGLHMSPSLGALKATNKLMKSATYSRDRSF